MCALRSAHVLGAGSKNTHATECPRATLPMVNNHAADVAILNTGPLDGPGVLVYLFITRWESRWVHAGHQNDASVSERRLNELVFLICLYTGVVKFKLHTEFKLYTMQRFEQDIFGRIRTT